MKAGELFIELGLKGANQAVAGLNDMRKGLSAIATETLQVISQVTGLIASFAGLAYLSGNAGAALQKFSNLTGLSAETLQRWQWMMRQSNVSAEDTTKSFENLQSAMAKIDLLHPPPDWLGFIGAQVNIDPKRYQDTVYMMGKIREYALTSMDSVARKRQILTEFGGFSQDYIQALLTNKLRPEDAPKGLIRSDKEIRELARIEAEWTNFYTRLGRVRDRFVEKYSGAVIGGLDKSLEVLGRLLTILNDINDAIGPKGMAGLGIALLAIFNPLAAAVAAALAALLEIKKMYSGEKSVFKPSAATGLMSGAGLAHGGLMPGFGAEGDKTTTFNITQNISSPSPEKAGAHSVQEFKNLISQHNRQTKGAYHSNPAKNEFGVP